MRVGRSAVVLYGISSPVVCDVEESLWRAGIAIASGVRNRDAPCRLSDDSLVITPEQLSATVFTLPFLVPLFTPVHRRIASMEARDAGFSRAFTLVDPTCTVPRTLDLGEGGYLNARCIVGAFARFGCFAFINRGSSIGHHLRAGNFVSIGPGAVIAGAVTIGDGALIGAGAVVLPKCSIGAHAVVGAGSVVTRDIPATCLVVGNPARIVRRDLPGFEDHAA